MVTMFPRQELCASYLLVSSTVAHAPGDPSPARDPVGSRDLIDFTLTEHGKMLERLPGGSSRRTNQTTAYYSRA